MTHPDDELEAMAEMVEHCQLWPSDRERAAAMLRAFKTSDAPDHSDWDAAIEAAASACISAIGGVTHYGSEPYAICAAAIRALKKGQANG